MNSPLFERVALIGLGLIGSSLSHVMRRENIAAYINGYARSQSTRDIASKLGLVDEIFESAADAVTDCDLVILCAPVGANAQIAAEIGSRLKSGAIITDVGSVKASVVKDIKPHVPDGVYFIPGHPIAGTEQSGPESGFAELFQDRWCILTPDKDIPEEQIDRLKSFWSACGSMVEIMDADHHDLVLAITSHIPHLIAYNIVGTADHLEKVTETEIIQFSASGFRDFTRLAASDPTMWRDVCLHNRDAILEMLAQFTEDLSALQKAIRWRDGDYLFNLFNQTRTVRRSIVDAGQEISAVDFGRHELSEDKDSET